MEVNSGIRELSCCVFFGGSIRKDCYSQVMTSDVANKCLKVLYSIYLCDIVKDNKLHLLPVEMIVILWMAVGQ